LKSLAASTLSNNDLDMLSIFNMQLGYG